MMAGWVVMAVPSLGSTTTRSNTKYQYSKAMTWTWRRASEDSLAYTLFPPTSPLIVHAHGFKINERFASMHMKGLPAWQYPLALPACAIERNLFPPRRISIFDCTDVADP